MNKANINYSLICYSFNDRIKVENCQTYDNIDFTCNKFKNGYYFIKEDKVNCYNNIKKNIFQIVMNLKIKVIVSQNVNSIIK